MIQHSTALAAMLLIAWHGGKTASERQPSSQTKLEMVKADNTPPGADPAQAARLPAVEIGRNYSEVRGALIKLGDKPLVLSNNAHRAGCDLRKDVCGAYPEAAQCAGTGLSPCVFFWKDSRGVPFALVTVGEKLSTITVSSVYQLHPDQLELVRHDQAGH